MKIYLVRHGQTNDNMMQISSRVDTDLSEKGIEQALVLKEKIESLDFKRVFVSSLKRTWHTAHLAGISKFEVDERIREIDLGYFQGYTFKELENKYPDLIEEKKLKPLMFKFPNGESYEDLYHRVVSFIEEKVKEGENILVFTHEGVIRSILSYVFGDRFHYYNFRVDNACVTEIEIIDGFKILNRLNF